MKTALKKRYAAVKKVGYLIAYSRSKSIFLNDLLSDKEENSSWCTVKRGNAKKKNMIFLRSKIKTIVARKGRMRRDHSNDQIN